jgi:hypothetical protein
MSTHDSFQAAREQAAEALGFIASERITAGDQTFEIPNPSLLDDDQQTAYDKLQFDSESWDHHDDVLNDDGTVKFKGALKEPHRKNGELVESYNIQLAKAILGKKYAAFKAAGGRASDVSVTWWKMNDALAKRRAADSKSVGSARDLETVPEPDSV